MRFPWLNLKNFKISDPNSAAREEYPLKKSLPGFRKC